MSRHVQAAILAGLMFCAPTLLPAADAQEARESKAAFSGSVFPDGPGRDLVAVTCTQCHSPQPFIQLRMNEHGWRNQVYNMILRGAQVGPDQIEPVVKYLSTAFGPGEPFPGQTPAKVTLAAGEGANLVEGGCQLCHGLDRVTATPRSHDQWQLIVNRMVFVGAPLDEAQKKTVVAYLSKHYAPKQLTAK